MAVGGLMVATFVCKMWTPRVFLATAELETKVQPALLAPLETQEKSGLYMHLLRTVYPGIKTPRLGSKGT